MRPATRTRASVAARTVAVIAVGIIAGGALAGCIDPAVDPMPGPTTSAPPTPTASQTAEPTPTASPTATAEAPTPIDSSCEALVPLQALYDLDPNLALLSDTGPTSALAAEAVAAGGVACTLVHTSTGATIELAVSSPGATALAAARAAAGDPIDLGIAGVDGYTSGTAVQAFSGALRYSAESAAYGADLLTVLIGIPIAVLG